MTTQNKKRNGFLKNFKIGTRLASGFVILIALMVVLAVVAMSNMKQVSYQIEILDDTSKAELAMASARIEQERFEGDKRQETADKVLANLKIGQDLLENVKDKIQSETVLSKTEEMKIQMYNFESEFLEFVTLEQQKVEQDRNRIAAGEIVSEDILRTLELEEEYIKTLTDAEEIQSRVKKYIFLKKASERFLEVRIAANKYVATESQEHAAELTERIAATKSSLVYVSSVIQEADIMKNISEALVTLENFKVAFDTYDDIVKQQNEKRNQMRKSAEGASSIAVEIKDIVTKNIADVEANSDRINILVVGVAIILSAGIAIVITLSITKPIASAVRKMKEVANYDISKDVLPELLNRKDEVGELTRGIQQIEENLRIIIGEISMSSQRVAASSEELSATSHQASETALDVAKTIEEIASGSNDQAKETEEGSHNINELGELIIADQGYVNRLKLSAVEVSKLKDEGLEVVTKLVKQTQDSDDAAGKVFNIIQATNVSAEKIAQASEMIKSIANQTNLLALNAAIEAARAGEAGRGFAVVADEIRKLAEQSNQFTGEIGKVIEELMDKASVAVDTMGMAKKIVDEQTQSVESTNAKFSGISNAISVMEEVIKSVFESSKEMELKKDEIINVMTNLSAISEENAAGTQEASAAMEEQTSSMDQIASSSHDLAGMAEQMQEIVGQFKL